MFDVNQVEKDAKAEVAKEAGDQAKTQIKSKLKAIAAARSVVANLEREYEILLKTIAE